MTESTKKTRLPMLSLNDLHKAFATVEAANGTIADLAAHLNRPVASVNQRLNVLRKRLREEHNVELGSLKRQPGAGRGRTKEDLSDIAAIVKAKLEAAE